MKRFSIGLVVLAVTAALVAVAASMAAAYPGKAAGKRTEAVHIVIKSDTEHGKKGPDGKWHDAFLPASFTVTRGDVVTVSVANYDDSMHTTFKFTATKDGTFAWHCDPKCDPWAMHHVGYMRGVVTVTG